MEAYSVFCRCGNEWRFACIEWPPLMIVCTGCGKALKLVAYDPKTGRTSYKNV